MTNRSMSMLHGYSAIAVLALALSASVAPAFAQSTRADVSTRLAQTTPLRMGNQATQQCLNKCSQRAQNCYRNAKSNSARESCENGEISCKDNCR